MLSDVGNVGQETGLGKWSEMEEKGMMQKEVEWKEGVCCQKGDMMKDENGVGGEKWKKGRSMREK